MMMFLLPVVTLMAAALSITTGRWFAKATLIAVALAYGVALAAISYDPYFEDNGAPEYIEWRFRWVLAAELGGWLTILTLPLVLAAGALYRRCWPARS